MDCGPRAPAACAKVNITSTFWLRVCNPPLPRPAIQAQPCAFRCDRGRQPYQVASVGKTVRRASADASSNRNGAAQGGTGGKAPSPTASPFDPRTVYAERITSPRSRGSLMFRYPLRYLGPIGASLPERSNYHHYHSISLVFRPTTDELPATTEQLPTGSDVRAGPCR
jgi:hypothetical protein